MYPESLTQRASHPCVPIGNGGSDVARNTGGGIGGGGVRTFYSLDTRITILPNDVIKKVYRWTVGDGGVAVSPTLVRTGVAEAVTIQTYTGFRP